MDVMGTNPMGWFCESCLASIRFYSSFPLRHLGLPCFLDACQFGFTTRGILDAWFDFGLDGDFGEQLLTKMTCSGPVYPQDIFFTTPLFARAAHL